LQQPSLKPLQQLTFCRGIEFQYRPSNHPANAPRYPLTFDQRLTQGDRYREASEELDASLQSIEKFYSSPNAGAHTGSPDCERCTKKKRRIMQAYYNYYLGNQPGRWDEHLLSYRQELENMFNSPGEVLLAAIHDRFKAELGEHLRKDLCAILPADSKGAVEYKMRVDELLRQVSIEEALAAALRGKIDGLAFVDGLEGRRVLDGTRDEAHPAGFNVSLQDSRTPEQRAELYVTYYCTPTWNDTPQQRNMKTKYGKLFESGMSHDTVLAIWKKEALDIKAREVDRLKQRLGELQMAQSAQLKNKKRKMEKDARMKDKEYVVVPRLVECSLPGCDSQMDVGKEGPIECAVCDWLARKSHDRRRFYYCSEEHVEEDFVSFHILSWVCLLMTWELMLNRMNMTATNTLASWVIAAISPR
jgi:hypothetical protein